MKRSALVFCFGFILSSCSFTFEGTYNHFGDTSVKLTSEFLPFTKINKSDIKIIKGDSESKKLSIFAVSNSSQAKAE